MPKSNRRNVTFELPKPEFDALEVDADVRQAGSRHQRARDIVVDYLTSPSTAELAEAIEHLEAELAYLQELIRRLTYSVIVHVGKWPSEEANQWIRKNMPVRPA
jgi:hypothetical protein